MKALMTGLALAALFALPACAGPAPSSSPTPRAMAAGQAKQAEITQIGVKDVAPLLKAHPEYGFIDVRNPDEFAGGHAPGVTLYPLPELAAWAPKLDPKRHYVVICRSGNRSMKAVNALSERGFTQLTNVQGGMLDWEAQGLPIEK